MKPVRQQRAGRGYLDAVLRDASRPYDYRGGLRRLLNIGAARPVRAAYCYGSLPFNLKYLQHSAYDYGSEWPVMPMPVAASAGNRHSIRQPQSAPVLPDDDWYQTDADSKAVEDRRSGATPQRHTAVEKTGTLPSLPNRRENSLTIPDPLQTPLDGSNGRISTERLRQGPPPLVTTRSIGSPQSGTQAAAAGIDSDAAINRDLRQGQDESTGHGPELKKQDKTTARNHLLSRLARQLEAHNFGDRRQDADRQSGADESRNRTGLSAQISQSDRIASADQGLPMQNLMRPSVPSAADTATNENSEAHRATMKDAAFVHSKKPATAFQQSPADTPMREQFRLMSNLKKQATTAQRPAGKAEAEQQASAPVKANKKTPAQKARPVVRHTIVRRTAAPAFWERSYLSHAALRIYK